MCLNYLRSMQGVLLCMKLGHHKGTKVTEPDFRKGVPNREKNLGEIFWCFLSISQHPVIETFWNFIYIISSTLSKTSRKQHVQEKSGSGCSVIFRYFCVFSHYVSSDAVVWTTWNLDRMYFRSTYVKIKKKILKEYVKRDW